MKEHRKQSSLIICVCRRALFMGALFGSIVLANSGAMSAPLLPTNLAKGQIAAPLGRKTLHGHVPPVTASLIPKGRLEPAQHLRLAIGLPLRDQEALTNLLHNIYDPASSNYRQFLTPDQFTKKFGPTENDYQSVIAFAKANGFTVTGTHPNRTLLDVMASAADIESAFHVRLMVYQHPKEARTFHSPDVEPSVDVAVPAMAIVGLNDYFLPHPVKLMRPIRDTMGNSESSPGSGSGIKGAYMGNDFRAAYVPNTSLTGSGQTVGLFELDGYHASDITNYEKTANISNIPLQNVLIDGVTGIPDPVSSNNEEVAMDIETAISMAPGLSRVIVYEGPTNSPGCATLWRAWPVTT